MTFSYVLALSQSLGVTSDGARSLASAMRAMPLLGSLYASRNKLASEGVAAVAAELIR